MRKRVFLVILLLFSIVVALKIGYVLESDAGGGCCLQRSDLNRQNWYRNGMDFRQCRDFNQQYDRDDLYSPTGYFWWNGQC